MARKITLAMGAPARLAHYRGELEHARNAPNHQYAELHKNRTWRDMRYSWNSPTKSKYPVIGRIQNKPGFLWADSLESTGWRVIGFADEILPRLQHKGWFADHYQDETIRGAVLQLPARNGVPQYVPALVWSDSDGVTIDVRDIADEKEDAARWADGWAERKSEESRDANAKDQAEQDIADARERIHEINKGARQLIREIKAAGKSSFSPAVCAALRARLDSYLQERREQFQTIEKRESDYWTAVQGY